MYLWYLVAYVKRKAEKNRERSENQIDEKVIKTMVKDCCCNRC